MSVAERDNSFTAREGGREGRQQECVMDGWTDGWMTAVKNVASNWTVLIHPRPFFYLLVLTHSCFIIHSLIQLTHSSLLPSLLPLIINWSGILHFTSLALHSPSPPAPDSFNLFLSTIKQPQPSSHRIRHEGRTGVIIASTTSRSHDLYTSHPVQNLSV